MVHAELAKTYLRRLLRTRAAVVAVLLAPLLVMVVAAMAFDSQHTYSLHVGTYAEKYSRDATTFINNLKEHDFQVTQFRDSAQCLDSLKLGTIVACMIFVKEPSDEVAIYIDYSKLNLVDSLMSLMAQRFSEQSVKVGANITAQMVQRIEDARAGLAESRPVIVSLTTHNEHSTQNVDAMLTSLAALQLKINQSLMDASLETQDNKFISWLSSLSTLVNEMVSQYSATMSMVREELDSIAIAESDKLRILELLNQGETELDSLKSQVQAGGQISKGDLDKVLALTAKTLETLKNIQAELDALKSFKTGSVDKLREIRKALDQNLLKFIQLQTSLNKIDKAVSGVQVEDPQNILAPLSVRVEPITTTTRRFELLFPNLLMLLIMFSSVLLASAIMVMHVRSPASMNKSALVSASRNHQSMLLAVLMIVGVQIATIFAVGLFFFGFDLVLVLPAALGISMVAAFAFSSAGLLIGLIFARESTAILAGVMGSSSLMLLSDVILPLEAFPALIRSILAYNPLVAGMYAIKRIVLFHAPLTFVIKEVLLLLAIGAICLGILALVQRKLSQKSFKASDSAWWS